MAYLFNGSSQYISVSTAAVTGSTITLACWFNSSSIDVNQGLINVCSASGDQNYRLSAMGGVAGDPIRAQTLNGASNATADTTIGYSLNTWTHACATFFGGSQRTSYINGGNSTFSGTTVTNPTGIDRMFIGVTRNGSAFTNYTTGSIAFVGIWNTQLVRNDILQLARGATPDLVRPQSLVFYAPLIRDLVDVRNGRALTNVNGTITDNPRIYS